jgi:Flp pilus assembly protein TadG
MVEFAMVIPLGLLLFFTIIQLSLLIYSYSFTAYASRMALRYAEVHGATSITPATAQSLTTYVQGLGFFLNQSNLTVTPTWTPNNQPGNTVSIKVAYSFPLMPIMISGKTIKVSSTTQGIIAN